MAIEIREYVTEQGYCPYRDWLEKQDYAVQARITRSVERIVHANFGDSKSVGGGINELRLDFGPGWRVYGGRDGQTLVILLAGGTKKRQQKDIEKARVLWKEYKDSKQK